MPALSSNVKARWAFLALSLSLTLVPSGASATTDGGESARLLGFAGTDQRYAVIVEENVQGRCGEMDCAIYTLDLLAKDFRPLWRRTLRAKEPWEVQEDTALVADYLKTVTRANARLLSPLRPVTGEPLPPLRRGDAPVATWNVGGTRIEAQLRELWTVESMATFDRVTEVSCVPPSGGTECSTCRQVTRWVDGQKLQVWACKPGQGTRTFVDEVQACDCHGRASMQVLELRDTRTGRTVQGSKVLSQPYELMQNLMSGPGYEGVGLSLGELEAVYVTARSTRQGVVIVTGAATHAPMANGTWFPVAAVLTPAIPKSQGVSHSARAK